MDIYWSVSAVKLVSHYWITKESTQEVNNTLIMVFPVPLLLFNNYVLWCQFRASMQGGFNLANRSFICMRSYMVSAIYTRLLELSAAEKVRSVVIPAPSLTKLDSKFADCKNFLLDIQNLLLKVSWTRFDCSVAYRMYYLAYATCKYWSTSLFLYFSFWQCLFITDHCTYRFTRILRHSLLYGHTLDISTQLWSGSRNQRAYTS